MWLVTTTLDSADRKRPFLLKVLLDSVLDSCAEPFLSLLTPPFSGNFSKIPTMKFKTV